MDKRIRRLEPPGPISAVEIQAATIPRSQQIATVQCSGTTVSFLLRRETFRTYAADMAMD
jgi:hypothetical protein